ncbi:MAG TPA: DNA topoisomerase 3 [Syntrophomonadaceae bacterium]|nr:DNA topoisomerase 3 [Syntrophomonadaceae bacterium]
MTEKPSVAQDISKALPGTFSRQDGYLESDNMIITWAVGHLLELAAPQDYDPQLKRWNIYTLPILPDPFQLKPKESTRKQLKIIEGLLARQDVDRLINGCDSAREGELIWTYLTRFLGNSKPFDRLWLSETTPAAIRTAFSNLRSSSEVANLAQAAISRSQADWIVGINATRGFTVQHGDKLTVGRVQTPTLALIVNREREIENFTPRPYWEIEGVFCLDTEKSYKGKWFRNKEDRFTDQAQAQTVLTTMAPGSPAVISSMEKKESKESSPQLFNLNDLQKECNKKYGFTAEQTLNIAQKLYEAHLLTYPRTDSRHLTQAMAATMPARLDALQETELGSIVNTISSRVVKDKRFVDDSKVTDHTAIIVTDAAPKLDTLNKQQQQVYLLIARRMVAIFLPPARIQKTTIITTCQEETFISKGKVILAPGWKALYAGTTADQEEESEPTLPIVSNKQKLHLEKAELLVKETKPPRRYTEADLLSAMENAGRKIEDEELREAMAGKGLGTPATRAAIIEKLISTAYIERQKKNLVPTDKGKYLIDIMTSELKDPELTAEWERKLLDMEQGRFPRKVFMQEIQQFTMDLIDRLKGKRPVKRNPSTDAVKNFGKCPLCGKPVIEGKRGYGCSGWRQGCKLVIWKEIAGRKISEVLVTKLLKDGRTEQIKGFLSEEGTRFDAILKLQDGIVEFDLGKK